LLDNPLRADIRSTPKGTTPHATIALIIQFGIIVCFVSLSYL
jgi:hypothetical protein